MLEEVCRNPVCLKRYRAGTGYNGCCNFDCHMEWQKATAANRQVLGALMGMSRKDSMRQEENIAADLGGRRVPASGALPGLPGDVKSAEWLVEAKCTQAQQYTLTLATLYKVRREAASVGRKWAMQVMMSGEPVAIIPWAEFIRLLGED